ncbi:ABC transporter permease subunit, partial [Vibrio parahaemolyticus]
TDGLGRDVLIRTLYGVRHSLPIALVVVLVSSLGGAMLGAIAGYVGGKTDSVIMRFVDITLSFPAILLAMAVTAALGPGLGNAAVAMVVVSWP